MTDAGAYRTIRYHFRFEDGTTREFCAKLEKDSLNLHLTRTTPPAEWTRLSTFRCNHCPLDEKRYSHCPVAVNLTDLLEFFRDHISHTRLQLTVETDDRTYSRQTSMQAAASGLMGIYMVTSGCPIMARLKPMVRFHLPFGTLEETKYRAISMYLVAQYLLQKQGKPADWSLAGLVRIYEDVRQVNLNFSNRLQDLRMKDSSLNAIAILDSFADFTSGSIDYEMQDELMQLFDAYLHPEVPS